MLAPLVLFLAGAIDPAVAEHEARHAVLAAILRVPFTQASAEACSGIARGAIWSGRGCVKVDVAAVDPKSPAAVLDVVTVYAGPSVAGMRDHEEGIRILTRFGYRLDQAEAIMGAARVLAAGILDRRGDAVKAVKEKLEEKGVLSGDDVRALVGGER